MSALIGASDGRQAPEVLDGDPIQVVEALMGRGVTIRSLRIARPIDASANGILQAILGGTCPQLDHLELEVDLSEHAAYLVGLFEALVSKTPPFRRLVLVFDPLPPPLHLLSVALGAGIHHATYGCRREGIWNVEAATIGDLLQRGGGAFRPPDDRTLVLVNPAQSRCDSSGRVIGAETWPDAVKRTTKVSSLLNGTRLYFARHASDSSASVRRRVRQLSRQTSSERSVGRTTVSSDARVGVG